MLGKIAARNDLDDQSLVPSTNIISVLVLVLVIGIVVVLLVCNFSFVDADFVLVFDKDRIREERIFGTQQDSIDLVFGFFPLFLFLFALG